MKITYYFAFPTHEVYIPGQQLQWTSTSLLAITVDSNEWPNQTTYDVAVAYITYELETNFGFVYHTTDIENMKASYVSNQWPDGTINIKI